ncbi:uracil-DNA glycosylase [Limnohabitans sp. 2KL-17]|uniref:uracil-DNA glycosylase n=1 Tax=Limnohabitans sp. 2KL-17 TaxID=1100704 RepID=UPI000D3C36B0|nr:uracil-DNA glycosylase [Limnohabitans sp. 2KL-17]PUE53897.1 uracil-DNA glycosylase [Limnohabitans sp. 2KL-17]
MSDPTRFDLNERQRAMLAEMGVRVWWPQHADSAAPQDMPQATAQGTTQAAVLAEPVAQKTSPSQATAGLVAASRPKPVTPPMRPAPVVKIQAVEELRGKPLAAGVEAMDWGPLADAAATCQACELCDQRKNSVFGVGDVQADWMVIGEPPSEEEDADGEPFVGPSGKLLDNMLKAIGLSRKAQGQGGVYITNVLKCRPPARRNPSLQELSTCAPYLARQVALVQPKVILLMGRFAMQSVLQTSEPLGKLRGQVHTYQGVPVVVTYHPASLLRTPADKAKAWADLVLALSVLGTR